MIERLTFYGVEDSVMHSVEEHVRFYHVFNVITNDMCSVPFSDALAHSAAYLEDTIPRLRSFYRVCGSFTMVNRIAFGFCLRRSIE